MFQQGPLRHNLSVSMFCRNNQMSCWDRTWLLHLVRTYKEPDLMACVSKSLYRHKSLSKAKIQRILVQPLTPYPGYFVLLTESCIALLTKQLSGPGNIISKTFEYGPQRRIASNQLFLFLTSRNGDSKFVLCVFTHVVRIYANLLEQKKAFTWETSSTPTGLVWDTNMAAISLFWDPNMAAMTSCENTQLSMLWGIFQYRHPFGTILDTMLSSYENNFSLFHSMLLWS